MADWSRFLGRPRLGMCAHGRTVSTLTAGLERVVCEDCGHVSVRYVTDTVKIFPEFDDITSPGAQVPGQSVGTSRLTCGKCDSPAIFMIPKGLACPEHAWAAASRQDALGQELWIPIRIDSNAKASG